MLSQNSKHFHIQLPIFVILYVQTFYSLNTHTHLTQNCAVRLVIIEFSVYGLVMVVVVA